MTPDKFLQSAQGLLRAVVVHDRITVVRWEPALNLFSTTDLSGREYPPGFVERFFAANPAVPYVAARPGIKIVTMTMVLGSEATIRASSFYRNFMQPMDWLHCAGLFFWDKSPRGVELVLNLLRSPDSSDFTRSELDRLRQIYPHLETAWRRVSRLAQEQVAQSGIEAVVSRLPVPLLVLDSQLQVTRHNKAARDASRIWELGGKDSNLLKSAPGATLSVPAELLAASAEIQKAWQRTVREERVSHRLERIVEHPTIAGFRAVLRLGFSRLQQLQDPWLVIEYERAPLPTLGANARAAALAQLSEIEREIALRAAEGESNQAIATAVHRSVSTVKWELHEIFQKLGVRNRTQLAARLR